MSGEHPIGSEAGTHSVGEQEIDWRKAMDFLRQRLQRKLRNVEGSDLDDLTQEASIRLLRAIRKEGARKIEALMTTIAQRTAHDFLRRRYRWLVLFGGTSGPATDHPDQKTPPPDEPGDPQERVEFIVYEFFRTRGPSCLKLAEAFFQSRSWQRVAGELGTTHDAVRARWSRCLSLLRKAVKADPHLRLLADWATG